MNIQIKNHRYDEHMYVVFDVQNPKPSGYIDYTRAWKHLKEAGFDVEPYGLSKTVTRQVPYTSEFDPEPKQTLYRREMVRCDEDTLALAALSLSRDGLQEVISQAFDLYQSAQETYSQEVKEYQESAGRRGRKPKAKGEKRDAFVGATVPPDIKEWAASSPEGISNLILRLLREEKEKEAI